MSPQNLKSTNKILKHLKRHYPGYKMGFRCETKFFIQIYIEDVYLYCNLDFCKKRDFIRRIHGRKLTKQILFVMAIKR
jgi:hypothetical protein